MLSLAIEGIIPMSRFCLCPLQRAVYDLRKEAPHLVETASATRSTYKSYIRPRLVVRVTACLGTFAIIHTPTTNTYPESCKYRSLPTEVPLDEPYTSLRRGQGQKT